MPTPRDSTDDLLLPLESSSRTSCPPEVTDTQPQWSQRALGDMDHAIADAINRPTDLRRIQRETASEASQDSSIYTCNEDRAESTMDSMGTDLPADTTPPPMPASPQTIHDDMKQSEGQSIGRTITSATDLSYSVKYGIPSSRHVQSHTSCRLRAGSKFRGTQTSEQQRYNVEVDIKSVDMAESFICGYLRIEGLTRDHPTITTYFEGEVIGPKYTFQTRHKSWGASEKDDLKHWGRFPAWKPLAKQAKKADFHYKDFHNRENIFMRWKEQFLVPDHRVREISGASFEGFYYICFNQVEGAISGIYYHSKSDQGQNNKIQNLQLEWVEDSGCFAAMEFR